MLRASHPFLPVQLERQLRLANARYKELQHELDHMKVQMAEAGQRNPPEKEGDNARPAKPAKDVTPKKCPVPIPQPAEDRSAAPPHFAMILSELCIPEAHSLGR